MGDENQTRKTIHNTLNQLFGLMGIAERMLNNHPGMMQELVEDYFQAMAEVYKRTPMDTVLLEVIQAVNANRPLIEQAVHTTYTAAVCTRNSLDIEKLENSVDENHIQAPVSEFMKKWDERFKELEAEFKQGGYKPPQENVH